MIVRERFQAALARQLGHPHGPGGRLVAELLNRRNRQTIIAAVSAAGAGPGQSVADVGFGGGLGLGLLLDAVGPSGHVHGIEPSALALAQAGRRHAGEVEAGRLALAAGTMDALPLEAGTLDGAISVNTVYFVEDLVASAVELARVLAPAGTIVLGIGDPERMRAMRVTAHGFRIREVGEIAEALAAGGLRLERDEPAGAGAQPARLLVVRRAAAVG